MCEKPGLEEPGVGESGIAGSDQWGRAGKARPETCLQRGREMKHIGLHYRQEF